MTPYFSQQACPIAPPVAWTSTPSSPQRINPKRRQQESTTTRIRVSAFWSQETGR